MQVSGSASLASLEMTTFVRELMPLAWYVANKESVITSK
jgi:hypothetical protein